MQGYVVFPQRLEENLKIHFVGIMPLSRSLN